MGLTPKQIEAIRRTSQDVFGQETQVWLFGSRVDDTRRGGDIDLLIHPAHSPLSETGGEGDLTTLTQKIRLIGLLERQLGERKIDVVIEAPGDTRPIVQVAHETGVRL